MSISRNVYVNNQYHTLLSDDYNDRPEFHRHHEHSLWTLFQVLKAGNNQVVIVNDEGVEEARISEPSEFHHWVFRAYPGFEHQLNKEVYTRYPHPNDKLK